MIKTIRVLSIFGTRPEAIKMAPLVNALADHPEIESGVCVTAQHRKMLDQVLDLFQITPEYDLNIMRPNQDLAQITQAVLLDVTDVLNIFKPDRILVHGDTTTSFAAALALLCAAQARVAAACARQAVPRKHALPRTCKYE